MTAIPAAIAGVRDIIAVCPRVDRTVMAAALAAGVTRLLRVGGAHAIAALAYGTKTIPRVDKIVGPGNAYVAAAKALVAPDCAIDFFAGPSEIAIVSSAGHADWIAADLLAQAEHDPDARAILFTPSRRLAAAVNAAVERQMPDSGPAAKALRSNGGIVLARSHDDADCALPADGARACGVRLGDGRATVDPRRNGVRRPLQRAGGRRLRDRVESRAADVRGGRQPRRAFAG